MEPNAENEAGRRRKTRRGRRRRKEKKLENVKEKKQRRKHYLIIKIKGRGKKKRLDDTLNTKVAKMHTSYAHLISILP